LLSVKYKENAYRHSDRTQLKNQNTTTILQQ
jgi:hypothetical protein